MQRHSRNPARKVSTKGDAGVRTRALDPPQKKRGARRGRPSSLDADPSLAYGHIEQFLFRPVTQSARSEPSTSPSQSKSDATL